MIFAIIENDAVRNVIVADEKFVKSQKLTAVDVTDLEHRPQIGDLYDGKNFIRPAVDEAETL